MIIERRNVAAVSAVKKTYKPAQVGAGKEERMSMIRWWESKQDNLHKDISVFGVGPHRQAVNWNDVAYICETPDGKAMLVFKHHMSMPEAIASTYRMRDWIVVDESISEVVRLWSRWKASA